MAYYQWLLITFVLVSSVNGALDCSKQSCDVNVGVVAGLTVSFITLAIILTICIVVTIWKTLERSNQHYARIEEHE